MRIISSEMGVDLPIVGRSRAFPSTGEAALIGGETMDKVNALGAGIALAVTLALVSALCAVAFVLAPDATLDFFSAFMHGLDLKSVKSAAPLSFGRVLYGLIGLSIIGFIAGFVFAWTYNTINRQ
jgi:hypothetical protein